MRQRSAHRWRAPGLTTVTVASLAPILEGLGDEVPGGGFTLWGLSFYQYFCFDFVFYFSFVSVLKQDILCPRVLAGCDQPISMAD